MAACNIHTTREPVSIDASHITGLQVDTFSTGGYSDIKCATLITHDPPINVAIKCFRHYPPHKERHEIIASIEEELLVWRILHDCPNVVDLFGLAMDLGASLGCYIPPYPVSECHDNGPLDQFIYRIELNKLQRLQLLTGVIRGVTYIHSKSIVHGDLKANNVVISGTAGDYVPKICDFGSSHSVCGACYEGSKYKAGTPQWSSPETLRGQPGTPKSDIWAFGSIALEVQFEKTPYHPNHRRTMTMRRPPSQLLPATRESIDHKFDEEGVDGAVWNAMQRCWGWDPMERPDAQGVLDALINILAMEVHARTVQNPVTA